ncbi:hypothetical protein O0I10_007704 [Lichtheimia ornata]|uniref:Histone chaperone domain-containing protein n=1 Tax=Lichtheimia ornata TaxID=688661 RepID=A0AAD7V1X9_9FUNG|nr:uncharacterized protein O0I10_007704 [Lichtheimia ornata]KAJ8656627.1 hypothetical protein O0I10_007704 [Lichtheimia ornata]
MTVEIAFFQTRIYALFALWTLTMVEINDDFFQTKDFQNKLESIIRNGDPGVLTASVIRGELEKQLGLEEQALRPWKKIVNSHIDTTFTKILEEEKNPPSEPEEEPSSQQEEDTQTPKESEPSHEEETKSDQESDNVQEEETSQRETPVSSASDNEATPSKKKPKTPKQPRKKRESKKEHKTSATEESIKRLKMYINKCGVRKVWQKELADCKTMKDQVEKLKKILADLGVEGRPTLEKCQKVKAEREIKAEVDSLDTENIIESTSRRATRSQGPKRKRRVIESDDEDDEEGPGQKLTRTENNPLDLSFLGDQSDSD